MDKDKILVFDMDGTIVDLYGYPNWLDDLRAENIRPYLFAKPMYNMEQLGLLLDTLKKYGYKIIVTTWCSMGASDAYKKDTREAKKAWLDVYDFPYDEFHCLAYGSTKAKATRHLGGYQILIDDNDKVRRGWRLGSTIDANKDIIKELSKLLAD